MIPFLFYSPDENNSGNNEENSFERFTARSSGWKNNNTDYRSIANGESSFTKTNGDGNATHANFRTTNENSDASQQAKNQDPFAEFRPRSSAANANGTQSEKDPFSDFRQNTDSGNAYQSFDPYSGFNPDDRPQPNAARAQTSMFFGIFSLATIFLCCGCGGILSLIAGVLAIIFAVTSKNGQPMTGPALVGNITGIIGTILSVLILLFLTLSVIISVNTENSYGDWYDEFETESIYPEESTTFDPLSPSININSISGIYTVSIVEWEK